MLLRGALLFVLVPVAVALVTSLFASRARLAAALRRPRPEPALRFGVDTFAFRNDSRIHHRGQPNLYSNWCFVLARAVVQFQRSYPHPRAQQERIAAETVQELQAGRPVQWLISDFPRIALNHSVLVYEYRPAGGDVVDFTVFDPNDPSKPGVIRFDRREQRFRPERLCGVDLPHLRAFRMYYSPLI